VKDSKHLKRRPKYSRSRLSASMEAVARRLARYAERAECELGEIGVGTSLRGFAAGLRDLADHTGERRMTLRPGLRRNGKKVQREAVCQR
jgi:hypothetical protein